MGQSGRTPASMRVRGAVRGALRDIGARDAHLTDPHEPPLVLVALSGGADSLALAAAVAAESEAAGARAGAVIVDHALQEGSAEVAERAALQARILGLHPVLIRRASVSGPGGPEASARAGRYRAFVQAAAEAGAVAVLIAHTRDDQAEQVLLGLARGSGLRSLSGMPAEREIAPGVRLIRPLLAESAGVTRAVTERCCAELGLEPWHDPHNTDSAFVRVRVRREVLPMLEDKLGPGVAAALARTADQAREDADALDALAWEVAGPILAPYEMALEQLEAPIELLAGLPTALRGRVLRLIAAEAFGVALTRERSTAIAALVTDWRGQGPIQAPGITVRRERGVLVFRRAER